MNILLIDTATETLSVALQTSAGGYYEHCRKAGVRHAELLVPSVEAVVREAGIAPRDIDLVVCSKGPGSFTGLRIGMATAKGIAYGSGCRIASVPSLDAISYGLDFFNGTVAAVVDARKGRVYCALYRSGRRTSGYLDITPDELLSMAEPGTDLLVTGPASGLFRGRAGWVAVDDRGGLSHAQGYIALGKELFALGHTDDADAGPLYVRASDAEIRFGGSSA